MGGLRFSVLGYPYLERDGQRIKVERRKAVALLVYLALNDQDQHRDKLAALFWPEYDQASARAALRRALFSLNQAISPDQVDANREWVGLGSLKSRSGFYVDVDRFHELLSASRNHQHKNGEKCTACLSSLEAAGELYQDDFLTGFSLRDAPEFDNWQLVHTEILRRELAEVLESLVEGTCALSDFERAIGFAHRWVAQDPFNEPAHYQLIRLYALSGQRKAALRHYQQCARLLERELGITPMDSIVQLVQAVKSDTPLPVPAPFSPYSPPRETKTSPEQPLGSARHPSDRPAISSNINQIFKGKLIGREREFAAMKNLWSQFLSGEKQILMVSGEAGIGKTHLVLEFANMVENQGAGVLVGRCDFVNHFPYAPIVQIIRTACNLYDQRELKIPNHILADLLTLSPQLQARYPKIRPNLPIGPQFEQQRLYDSFVAWFTELAQSKPILMIIEDIHWADSDTLQLLHHLIVQKPAGRLFLIMTYRETELDIAEKPIFQQVLLDLNRERMATYLDLPRLNREQTGELLSAVLKTNGEISLEFLESIFRETEGNPFYIEEVCKTLIEEGNLFFAGGYWRRSDIQSIVIPKSVRSAILSRVAKLSPPLQEMLRLAAILGHEFDFATLKGLSSWDQATLESMLESARQAQFIQEVSQGGSLHFSFTHALIPFTLRESLSGLQMQRLHRRAATIIQAKRPDDYEILAYHYTASGEYKEAIYYLLKASQRAKSLYAFDSALQHLYSALNLVELNKEHSDQRPAILEQLADIQRLSGERIEAILHYQEALDSWRNLANADKWTAVRLHRKIGETFLLFSSRSDIERFVVVAQANLELGLKLTVGEQPHPETVRLLTTLANDAWEVGIFQDWNVAEGHARAAVNMAEQLDMPLELSKALDALSTIYGVRGLQRERVQLSQRRIAISRDPRFGDKREQCQIFNQTGNTLLLVGEYTQAMSYLLEAERLAGQIHDVNLAIYALGIQAQCLYSLDRWDEMMRIEEKRRSLEERYGADRVDRMCFYCGLSANVSALRGEFGQAHNWREIAYHHMEKFWGGPPDKWSKTGHY